jgi:hypothetical protein
MAVSEPKIKIAMDVLTQHAIPRRLFGVQPPPVRARNMHRGFALTFAVVVR